jgi:hypothetical protein
MFLKIACRFSSIQKIELDGIPLFTTERGLIMNGLAKQTGFSVV